MKTLANSLAAQRTGFVILPPLGDAVPDTFKDVEVDDYRYGELLADMQRFRGATYLFDGAILPTQLSGDGRHILPIDKESWHVLTLKQEGNVCACLRFHEEVPAKRYHDLGIRSSAMAHCDIWGETLRKAVEIERFNAQEEVLRFGEVGGWAISTDRRNTAESLRIILATYGLLMLLGGSIGLATATCKHGSASILRRLGLSSLTVEGVQLPSYYDPDYRSEMEVLRFDSRTPSPKYVNWITELSSHLANAPVICAKRQVGYPSKPGQGTVKHWWPIPPVSDFNPAPKHVS